VEILSSLLLFLQGLFEILSLSGSFTPNESGGTRSRSGGMSVSLASPDGRVVGGGVAGLLVAASPVQVCIPSIRDSSVIKSRKFFYFKSNKFTQIGLV
jgi:hypothetical protein